MGKKVLKNIICRVVHSQSKTAWNVIGAVAGSKYKLARVPYIVSVDMEVNEKNLREAFSHAEYICMALKNAEFINRCLDKNEEIAEKIFENEI